MEFKNNQVTKDILIIVFKCAKGQAGLGSKLIFDLGQRLIKALHIHMNFERNHVKNYSDCPQKQTDRRQPFCWPSFFSIHRTKPIFKHG